MQISLLTGIEEVVKHAKSVSIDTTILSEFTADFNPKNVKMTDMTANLVFRSVEEKVQFLLVFNSINFCLWSSPQLVYEWNGQRYIGSQALLFFLKDKLDKKPEIVTANFLQNLDRNEFDKIMTGITASEQMYMSEERFKIFREIGGILQKQFNNLFINTLAKADYDAGKLVKIIVNNFPMFDDKATHQGKKVTFYKRAQLIVSMISISCSDSIHLKNVQTLTGFADYRVPQLLRHLNILKYSDTLAQTVDNQDTIRAGSAEEVEIRAHTIWAIELMKKYIREKKQIQLESWQIDNYLWGLNKQFREVLKPHHRTETIFY